MQFKPLFYILIALALGACAAMGPAAPVRYADGVLVNDAGMTLYTFDKDVGGQSACYDKCAALWPPLYSAADARGSGDWTVVQRKDGRSQWAYQGKPLYLWVKDQKAGDKTGDNVNNVWHVIRAPAGAY